MGTSHSKKKAAITVKIAGRQKQAIASALYHAFAEFFDVQYEGPNGEPLPVEKADSRIDKLCRDRLLTAKITVSK